MDVVPLTGSGSLAMLAAIPGLSIFVIAALIVTLNAS